MKIFMTKQKVKKLAEEIMYHKLHTLCEDVSGIFVKKSFN